MPFECDAKGTYREDEELLVAASEINHISPGLTSGPLPSLGLVLRTSNRQVFKSNETRSGGAGAGPTAEGRFVAAGHPFDFMGGRAATMIWEDGIRIVAGGDDNNLTIEAIIPDWQPGSGSSVPGGPGVLQMVGATTAVSSSKRPSSKPTAATRNKKRGGDKAELIQDTKSLLDLSTTAARQEIKAGEVGGLRKARAADLAAEGLLDDVQRLQGKVNAAESPQLREMFQVLLNAADARAKSAVMERNEAAAASLAAAASPTSPLVCAPSTLAAVGGGVGLGRYAGGASHERGSVALYVITACCAGRGRRRRGRSGGRGRGRCAHGAPPLEPTAGGGAGLVGHGLEGGE